MSVVKIEIDATDEEDILTHLSFIRQKVKKLLKVNENNSKVLTTTDNNCYGMHTVKITKRKFK